jgi:hypothetical protein
MNERQFPSPAMSVGPKFALVQGSLLVWAPLGPYASRLGATASNPTRNGPRKALGTGPTHLLMITPSEFVCLSSGDLTIIMVVQHSAQPLAALNRSTLRGT